MSTAGLQCFDDVGNLIWATQDGLGRIVLTGYTNSQGSGNVLVPEWNGANRPWFCTVNPVGFNFGYIQPGFQINGNLLQWYVGYVGVYPNIKYICGIY